MISVEMYRPEELGLYSSKYTDRINDKDATRSNKKKKNHWFGSYVGGGKKGVSELARQESSSSMNSDLSLDKNFIQGSTFLSYF
jgi:hypothetical protein